MKIMVPTMPNPNLSTSRGCPTCVHWKATEMEAYKPHAQPHEARAIAAATEMLRATHALCTWEPNLYITAVSPTWAVKSINHGNLTSEDDGGDCKAWVARVAS